jgi:hypothetical protein
VSFALVVGPDRAAGLAVEKMSADDLAAVVSLLQPAALALSAATYVGATEALIGFVPGRLSFRFTLLTQLASSFVTLTPSSTG